MQEGDVVSLEVVVDVRLPIALEGANQTPSVGEIGEGVLANGGVERTESGRQRRRALIEIDEHEWAPRLDTNRSKGVVIGCGRVAEVAGRLQGAVPTERPSVVAADQISGLTAARPLDHAGPMWAHVVEAAQISLGIDHHQERITGDLVSDVLARS